ncbi:hypothetical protein Acsp03_72280 [Actinomadura sp. NBRC 104412]|nr:hypothetical protein Acsp03_72280 [Actinomadura sp. NBRC 104412]
MTSGQVSGERGEAHRWDKQRPTQPTITAHPSDAPTPPKPDAFPIHRPDSTFTIAW